MLHCSVRIICVCSVEVISAWKLNFFGLAGPVETLLEFKPNTKPSCKVASSSHSQSFQSGKKLRLRYLLGLEFFRFAPSPVLRLDFLYSTSVITHVIDEAWPPHPDSVT